MIQSNEIAKQSIAMKSRETGEYEGELSSAYQSKGSWGNKLTKMLKWWFWQTAGGWVWMSKRVRQSWSPRSWVSMLWSDLVSASPEGSCNGDIWSNCGAGKRESSECQKTRSFSTPDHSHLAVSFQGGRKETSLEGQGSEELNQKYHSQKRDYRHGEAESCAARLWNRWCRNKGSVKDYDLVDYKMLC